ncbi:MAG TPA: hypothetical protein VM163_08520 [bacterium]|nr:hypothetical protein [bacterium]
MTGRADRATSWPVFAIVVVGIALRLAIYLHGKSLWIDEAMLGVNVAERSYGQLLERLDCMQVAPPLFLFISRFMYASWGHLEYSLRLFPLVCGSIALVLMARLLLKLSSRFSAVCAVAIAAFGLSQVQWATSFKQYASDELCAVLILIAAVGWECFSARTRYALAALLPALVWVSYTSVFVLSGLAAVALSFALKERRGPKRGALIVLLCSMAIASSSIYAATVHRSVRYGAMMKFWADGFPHPPYTTWLFEKLVDIFGSAVDLEPVAPLILGICIWGAWSLAKSKRWPVVMLAAVTFFSAVAAASLRIYPLVGGRLTIYWAPIALLFLASGLDAAYRVLKSSFGHQLVRVLGVGMIIGAFCGLAAGASKLIVRQEMRQVLNEVEHGAYNDASIAVSVYASPAFLLYAGPKLKKNAIWLQNLGLDSQQLYWAWLTAGQPARFWLVVSHADFDFLGPTLSGIRPFSKIKKKVRLGNSAAFLIEPRPQPEWPKPRKEH